MFKKSISLCGALAGLLIISFSNLSHAESKHVRTVRSVQDITAQGPGVQVLNISATASGSIEIASRTFVVGASTNSGVTGSIKFVITDHVQTSSVTVAITSGTLTGYAKPIPNFTFHQNDPHKFSSKAEISLAQVINGKSEIKKLTGDFFSERGIIMISFFAPAHPQRPFIIKYVLRLRATDQFIK